MKKSFLIGGSLSFILLTLGFLTQLEIFALISGGIGVGCLLLGGILSGAFVSGENLRANFATESSQDRKNRHHQMFLLLAFGTPNIIVAILLSQLV